MAAFLLFHDLLLNVKGLPIRDSPAPNINQALRCGFQDSGWEINTDRHDCGRKNRSKMKQGLEIRDQKFEGQGIRLRNPTAPMPSHSFFSPDPQSLIPFPSQLTCRLGWKNKTSLPSLVLTRPRFVRHAVQ